MFVDAQVVSQGSVYFLCVSLAILKEHMQKFGQ